MKRVVLILFVMSVALASTRIQVLDEKTGSALQGVNITIVGTSDGFNTNSEGYFNLDEKYLTKDLKFSYMGYIDTTLSYHEVLNLGVVTLSPDVLNVGEIEVVSTKLEWEQTDLPSIVTILRTKDLVNQGSIEIKEALQRDPSVVVDESVSGEHTISIRGSNANEVLIVYDDIPLNSSHAGGFDLSWLNLNDVESISIIKGAGTLQYGSGAFGGVVVLKPAEVLSNGLSWNYQKSDRNLKSYSVSDAIRFGPLKARASYSAQDRLPMGYFNEDIMSTREFLNVYSTYALKDTGNQFSLNVIDVSERVDPFEDYESDLTDKYTQIKYRGALFNRLSIGLQMMNRIKGNELLNALDPTFIYSDKTNETTELLAIESRLVLKTIINYLKLEIKQNNFDGASEIDNIHWEFVDHHDIKLSQDWKSLTNIFKYRTDLNLPVIDFIELNASYRYDDIQLTKDHQNTFGEDVYLYELMKSNYDQISKRSGATLSKTRDKLKYQLFYTAGTNLRYPSMNELYLRDQTSIIEYQETALAPELNSSSELGFQASIQPKDQYPIFDHVDFQASVFDNKYVDKIYNKYMPRALPTPVNTPSTKLSGWEFSMGASMLKELFKVHLGRTAVDISSFTIFPNKPEFKDVVEAELMHKHGNIRVQYFHEGRQFFGGTSDNINWYVTELEGRENLNLYSSIKFISAGRELVLGFSALNLLSDVDEQYFFDQRKWTLSIGMNYITKQ